MVRYVIILNYYKDFDQQQETINNEEKFFGRTKYLTPVVFVSNNCKSGELVNVHVTSFNQKNLFGFHKTNNKVEAA